MTWQISFRTTEIFDYGGLWHLGYEYGELNQDGSVEKPITFAGSTRYPDFTIEDEISGRVTYWEHLGMLGRDDYRRSWEGKLAWYRSNGILPAEEGGGPQGLLLTTTESSTGGFDSAVVKRLISTYLNS